MNPTFSYYRLLLTSYLQDHFPERSEDARFIQTRADIAAEAYSDTVRTGFSHPQAEEAVEAVRRTYGLPERFLLYVGSDRPHKNVTTLLHALALMDPTASMPLALAGFDSNGSPLRREAEELDLGQRVLWLGRIPDADLPALYSAAHAFLFPSLVEGFGFPVLEAMACGTPVICSALGVHKEITGGAAKLVHPTDRQEWRRAIHAAIISLDWHDVYRGKGLTRAARFSWAEAARATLEIYRQLYPKPFAHSTKPPPAE